MAQQTEGARRGVQEAGEAGRRAAQGAAESAKRAARDVTEGAKRLAQDAAATTRRTAQDVTERGAGTMLTVAEIYNETAQLTAEELQAIATFSSVPLLTEDSQIGANLRVCADEENRTDFDQRS
jgi:hypothetical protein